MKRRLKKKKKSSGLRLILAKYGSLIASLRSQKALESIKYRAKVIWAYLVRNNLALANLVLSAVILARVEAINTKLGILVKGINDLLSLVLFTMSQWQGQIENMVYSIIRLFGGEGV